EFRYITDRLDGRRWTVLAVKSKFIKEFLMANNENRVIEVDTIEEDSDSDILETLSQAAGDPRILISEKLKKDIQRLQSKERLHTYSISDAVYRGEQLTDRIASTKNDIKVYTEAAGILTDALANNAGENFTATVKKKKFTSRKGFDKAVTQIVDAVGRVSYDRVEKLGTVMGLDLELQLNNWGGNRLVAKAGEIDVRSEKTNIQSLAAQMRAITKQPARLEESLEEMERSKERMAQTAVEPFKLAGKMKDTIKALANLEEDMRVNPVPPPSWLRQGAPVNTDVYHNGKKKLVTGHRWNNEGFYVLSENEEIPYMDAKDTQGIEVYEEHPFTVPEVITQVKKDADGNEITPTPEVAPEAIEVLSLSPLGNDINQALINYNENSSATHKQLVDNIYELIDDTGGTFEYEETDNELASTIESIVENYQDAQDSPEGRRLSSKETMAAQDEFNAAIRDAVGIMVDGRDAPPVLFSANSRIKNKPLVSIPRANLNAVVARFKKQYSGAQQLNFIIRGTQAQAFGENSVAENGRVKGGFYPGTNDIVLIAENITNNRDAMTTLRHEIVGHYGLRQLLNKEGEYDALLDRVDAARDDELKDLYTAVEKAYPEIDDKRHMADEVLAMASQTKVKPGFFAKIYAQIIKLLHKFGLMRGPISRREVSALIELSTQRMRKPFTPVRGKPGDAVYQRAYHGSPHKFDKFSTSNIGTGEGAQAYGYGLYFAEDKSIASWYHSKLSGKELFKSKSGHTMNGDALANSLYEDLFLSGVDDNAARTASNKVIDDMLFRGGKKSDISGYKEFGLTDELYDIARDKVIHEYTPVPKKSGAIYEVNIPDKYTDNFLDWDAPLNEQPEIVQKALKDVGIADAIYNGVSATQADNAGRTLRDAGYTVVDGDGSSELWMKGSPESGWKDIPENSMLLKLSKQRDDFLSGRMEAGDEPTSPTMFDLEGGNVPSGGSMYEKLSKSGFPNKEITEFMLKQNVTGGALYGGTVSQFPEFNDTKNASELLNSLGIKGIKYYDGGSRKKGKGTRNLVVFDESIIEITSRNDKPLFSKVDSEVLHIKTKAIPGAIEMGYPTEAAYGLNMEVLKNPTQSEVTRFGSRIYKAFRENNFGRTQETELRFIIDDKGDTCVWDANSAIHSQVLDKLPGINLDRSNWLAEASDSPMSPSLYMQVLERHEHPYDPDFDDKPPPKIKVLVADRSYVLPERRFRKVEEEPVGSTFGLPDETRVQQFVRLFQNAFNR
ncbi:MAG: hypothetical protein DRI65_13765, partial [Chloroflexota bacterium]